MVSLCCSPRKVSHTRGSHVELTNTRARRAHLLIVALKSIFYIYLFSFPLYVCVYLIDFLLFLLCSICMCMRIRIRISFVEDDVSFKLVLAFAVCVSASSSSSLNSSTCANETGNSN